MVRLCQRWMKGGGTLSVGLLLLGGFLSHAEESAATAEAPLTFESQALQELAGTWGEPLRALMLLPGVGHVVSGAPLPVVRGAQPSATAVYLDGVRVPQLYHLGLGPSVLGTELISGFDFHRGAAPARFGRKVGGFVDVRPVAPATEGVRAVASLDLVNVGLLAQVPLPATGTELTLGGHFGWTPWLAAAWLNGTRTAPGPDVVLELGDYQARLTQAMGKGSLRLFAFGGSDTAGLRGVGDVVAVQASFHRVDLRLTHPVGAGEAEAALTWGHDALGLAAGGETSRLALTLAERTLGARVAWRMALTQGLSVEAGADVEQRLAWVDQSTTFHPGEPVEASPPTATTRVLQPLARATYAGAYAQATWAQGPWRLTPGLRVDGYHLGPGWMEVVLEPRLHARWTPSETVALHVSAGLFHQPPASLVELPGADGAALPMGLQRVVELEAGADMRGPAGFTFSAGAFLQPLLRTVELDLLSLDFLADDLEARARAREARGLAYGVELMAWRPLAENVSLLASYTFQQRTLRALVERRDDTGAVLGAETVPFASAYEQAHLLNVAVAVRLPWGLIASTTLHFNTGAPEAGGLSSYTQREGVDAESGAPRWTPVDRDAVARLPAFFRVDGRIAKAGRVGPVAVEGWVDVFNLTLARETFRYTYGREDGALVRKPFGVPPLTLPSLGVRARY